MTPFVLLSIAISSAIIVFSSATIVFSVISIVLTRRARRLSEEMLRNLRASNDSLVNDLRTRLTSLRTEPLPSPFSYRDEPRCPTCHQAWSGRST